jgi:hypothetical protein
MRARQKDGRGAGHAHDAEHLATDRQTINCNAQFSPNVLESQR